MSYEKALIAAGCEVLEYKTFGDYQGTWLAFVIHEGKKGIIEGAYGSCSGCDAFEAEFSGADEPYKNDKTGEYFVRYETASKEEYDEALAEYNRRLAEFGAGYLAGGTYDKDHYENKLARLNSDDWFDRETEEYCKWVIGLDWD